MTHNQTSIQQHYAREADDIPFFPFSNAQMKQSLYGNEITEAQSDFVQLAGIPLILKNENGEQSCAQIR